MTLDRFLAGLPFPPDRFQKEALAAVAAGRSVVVTAPTGSGKTLVAEGAVHLVLEAGRRAFYTAPIKALSNQKFRDFRAVYGTDRVGLLTGDNSINGEAPLVVMTTEVLRNMIYADSDALESLELVVLDEVHYLQDRFRGSVWEEVIIHLPHHVRLVSLSATIANAAEFTAWMRERRGDTALVSETHRPVPLESLYLLHDRHHDAVDFHPVFVTKGGRSRPNPRLHKLLRTARGRRRRFVSPRRTETIRALHAARLLPAIYFLFSRAGCDQAARTVAGAGLDLVTTEEAERIRDHAADRTAHLSPRDLSVLGYETWLDTLTRGVAPHHAGLVPAFKETAEELFAAGLLRVVFATETLALGINMPARTVVLEQMAKFTGETHEVLQPGDYTQLTGRAGRRGIDDAGTAVVLHNRYLPFERVAAIAAAGSHPLESSFTPGYNMAVNLVANYPQHRAEELLSASFAQFRTQQRRAGLERRIAGLTEELDAAGEEATCEYGPVEASDGEAAAAQRDFATATAPGDVLRLGGRRWVLLVRGYGPNPRLLALSADGELRRLEPDQLPSDMARIGSVPLPEPFRPRDPGFQKEVLGALETMTETGPAAAGPGDAPHTAATCPDLERHLAARRRIRRLEKDLRRLTRRVSAPDEGLVDRFHALLGLLRRRGHVQGWALTPAGERLRFVYNELDLLLTDAALQGIFDGAGAAELAALVSAFVYEARPGGPEGDWPTPAIAERGERILRLAVELNQQERSAGLPESRLPDPGFAPLAHAWASGVELEDLFGSPGRGAADLVAGDFVRTCRQLLDLLRQLRDVFPDLAAPAAAAVRAVDRGVVATEGFG